MTPRKHKWMSPITIRGTHTQTGCEQSERQCEQCGMIKITVHPPQGFPWREWRHPKSPKQFTGSNTPPCCPPGEVKAL